MGLYLKDIDKDIMSVLTGKKEYSPDNCVFVTHDLNGFFVNTNKKTTLPVKFRVESEVGPNMKDLH